MKPQWFAWNDDPEDHTGYYDRHEMDKYIDLMQASYDAAIGHLRDTIRDFVDKHPCPVGGRCEGKDGCVTCNANHCLAATSGFQKEKPDESTDRRN